MAPPSRMETKTPLALASRRFSSMSKYGPLSRRRVKRMTSVGEAVGAADEDEVFRACPEPSFLGGGERDGAVGLARRAVPFDALEDRRDELGVRHRGEKHERGQDKAAHVAREHNAVTVIPRRALSE